MKQRFSVFAAFAAVALGACGDAPTEVTEGTVVTAAGEMVITEGIAAPEWVPVGRRADSEVAGAATTTGSISTPVTLKPASCEPAGQSVVLTFTITGNQAGTATFQVYTSWTHNGADWTGSNPVTVTVPPRASQVAPTVRTVTLTVTNTGGASAGASTLSVEPFDFTNSNQTGAKLAEGGTATVHVVFAACPVTNTPPALVLPNDLTVQATSSSGAVVNFTVTANDLEDGDLTAFVQCDWTGGDTFPLGTTTISCSVTDTHGATTHGSFEVTIEDTTPAAFTNIPSGTLTAIAADIGGAVIDLDTFGITVEDFGNVSEPSDYECDYVAGTVLAIGSTTTISCTASDAIGNESAPSTFNVFVGLNVTGSGFLPPLRNATPFSAHKRGSTIPHKFPAPTYADGTPATDLAGGISLKIKLTGSSLAGDEIDETEFGDASVAWRYDPTEGHYIFNLKTLTSWQTGAWTTTAAYAGIVFAQTQFEFRR